MIIDLRACQFQTEELLGEKGVFQGPQDDRDLLGIWHACALGGVDWLSQN